MQTPLRLILLLNVLSVFTAAGVTQSQINSPQAEPSRANEAGSPPPSGSSGAEPHTVPVFWVSSVEVFRSAHAPALDVIRVRGYTSTEGWESAELVPLTKGLPADGILDLAFVASAPENNTTPSAFPLVEAVFTLEPGHPFKGVRVHGATNRVSLTATPGYAETSSPPQTCSNCVGKYLVRKGTSASPNRPKDTLVREEDLPHKIRILRDSEGIGTSDSDSNRMTLLLNDKGEVAAVLWD